ncbi:MAG: HAD family phosphatase [Subdoligranulum variabile]|uniref:HAD family hydrolase n=1 Tax=Gemmiger sp. TaxID=2049027 RepID=UPI0025F7E8AC|nr:HAD family phosphatase [Gemmiger sp.]MBD8951949.1 HAD family phosphatase [Subdoligranulum sp.]MCI6142822.1 HAD family phosphatase [Subdoligranulum variabile]MBD8952834.1 HAD family phosphatase [Subdoligranulum sp.]MCI6385507.1 HAD family phosphatase [Subdoligranulum variabile]MCI7642701.1 HAD family phosphatase [Subdoligranulum variabile]
MYKNIIFDFGGVVVQFNPKDFLMDHFMNKRAEEIVYELTFGSQEWQDLDRGIITREEGNAAMLENAARVNRVFEVQTVIDEWPAILRTKESTVHTMQKLKAAGYRLYYLTNIPADIMDELRQREWFSLFDGGVASCDVHLCKPEPAIYTTLMQTCNLAYDESIFIDDNKVNAQAAYNLGITGILYKNPKSFERALHACGIVLD